MWSKFKYFISSTKSRFIIILMLTVIFLGGLIYTHFSKETLPPTVFRIAIDETWYPLKLYDKEQYISAFSEDLLRKIAAQQHFSVQIVRVGSENRLGGLDNGQYEGILSSLILQDENTEKYISSNPYYLLGPVLVLSKSSQIKSLKDLKGKTIGLINRSETIEDLEKHSSNIADGQAADLEGRLLTAETTGRKVSITEINGEVKTLVGFYEGKPLNSPNDVIVKSNGTVWFTDPGYGCLQFPQECYLPNNVYRFDPKTKELKAIITNLKMPNGIAFSPNEKILYVIDSGAIQAPRTYDVKKPHAIYAFDVDIEGRQVANQRLFANVSPGFPEGMRLNASGNIYVGALDGVQVFNPAGKLIGKILMPKETANLTFGGKDNNILFICSSDSNWAIKLNAKGAKPIPEIGK